MNEIVLMLPTAARKMLTPLFRIYMAWSYNSNSCLVSSCLISQVGDAHGPVLGSGRHETAVATERHARHLPTESKHKEKTTTTTTVNDETQKDTSYIERTPFGRDYCTRHGHVTARPG